MLTIDLDYLLELTAEYDIDRTELINRWRRWFMAQNMSEVIDAIMLGLDITVEMSEDKLKQAAKQIVKQRAILSQNAKRFIEADLNLDNLGKTTEQLCMELKIDPSIIYEESLTQPYQDYCNAVRSLNLQSARYRCQSAILFTFTKLMRDNPSEALAHLMSAAKTPALGFFLENKGGDENTSGQELTVMDVDFSVTEVNPDSTAGINVIDSE